MSENKYNNSKIYLIKCRLDNNLIYVGSTVHSLNKRWKEHKNAAIYYKKKNLLHKKMNELGHKYFNIELIINYPCENKEELFKLEGEYIKKLSTLNKKIEGRKIKEYREDNRELIKEKNKEYREQNKELIKEKNNEYREQNKEKIKEYREQNKIKIYEQQKEYRIINKYVRNKICKDYYYDNKDKILLNKSTPYTCNVCNCTFRTGEKSRHFKTQKHMKNINSNHEENYI